MESVVATSNGIWMLVVGLSIVDRQNDEFNDGVLSWFKGEGDE